METPHIDGLMIQPRNSLEDEVHAKLLDEITSLRLAPNARLSVDSLARLLGVSQTPVRAALIRLEAEGLVEKKLNSGFRVAVGFSREEFEELYELRLLLEPVMAGKAAKLATEEDKAELVALSDQMTKEVGTGHLVYYREFALLDRQFHQKIHTIAGNKLFCDVLGRLHTHMHLYQLRGNSTVAEEAMSEHDIIVAAIMAGDEAAAAEAMRDHILIALKRMQAFYDAKTG